MGVRGDLSSVDMWLQRLAMYAQAFDKNNTQDWPHLKNREDFSRVYSLPVSQCYPLEDLYGNGRDLAVAMSERLVSFNWVQRYPTLKSFVDSFDGGWVNQVDILEEEVSAAESIAIALESCPWAVKQMIELYKAQINMLRGVAHCLEMLRKSDLYLIESGRSTSSANVMAYDAILKCIDGVGKMFERLPSTYSEKDEEGLRDHMLVSLEAAVNGGVTGETFNKRGKTDILVRNEGNTCFVGECKFWTGPSGFENAINQLLSYLSWRDTSTALIIFVRNKDFTAVIQKADEVMQAHKCFNSRLSQPTETWIDYEFIHPDDPLRKIKTALMLYHLVDI